MLQFVVRLSTEVEAKFTSVERLQEYITVRPSTNPLTFNTFNNIREISFTRLYIDRFELFDLITRAVSLKRHAK